MREQEIFKPIKDFPNYEVSNLGNVKSLNYRSTGKSKLLKPQIASQGGYCQVRLTNDDNPTGKFLYVHRLVAQAFIPNPNRYPEIDHINAIKTDNRTENIRWCTRQQNMNYARQSIEKVTEKLRLVPMYGKLLEIDISRLPNTNNHGQSTFFVKFINPTSKRQKNGYKTVSSIKRLLTNAQGA